MSRLISIALAIFFTCMTAVLAAPLNLNGDGIAIQGYDPVAYFEMGKPVEGMASIAAEYEGAVYRFSIEANRAAFEANPERYVPAYGGYCAYGLSEGYQAAVDPTAFTIVDDRLFLNYSHVVRDRWQQEQATRIESADGHWQKMLLE